MRDFFPPGIIRRLETVVIIFDFEVGLVLVVLVLVGYLTVLAVDIPSNSVNVND